MSIPSGAPELRRVIGFWGGTALIVGITIGSGIFRKPPTLAGLVPHPGMVLALWVFFGVVSLCGALALAKGDALSKVTDYFSCNVIAQAR